MTAAVLITNPGDAIVAFDFSYSVVEELKARIPAYARTYNPASKQWTIAAGPFVSVAIDLLKECFGPNKVHVSGADASAPTAGNGDAYAVLHLRPTAPPELVKAAHKTLAKLNHPDKGGSTSEMQAINQAVSVIQEGQTS